MNESGASIYSVSDIAQKEMPDLDPSLRGAVSIARRLQDPLVELVKTEPKHIGVGMYQVGGNRYVRPFLSIVRYHKFTTKKYIFKKRVHLVILA